jgi:hypothetical protein
MMRKVSFDTREGGGEFSPKNLNFPDCLQNQGQGMQGHCG